MIKKILTTILLYFLVNLYCFSSQNVITYLITNDCNEHEIEIIATGKEILIPCKSILKILEISYKENHVEKSLTFKNAVIKNNTVYINGAKQPYQSVFQKNGISGPINEYFVPAEALAEITGENIKTDPNQLLVFIKSDEIEATPEDISLDSVFVTNKENNLLPKAYQDVTLPEKSGWATLDSIAFSNNLMSDSYSQIYRESKSNNFLFNNNSKVTLNGKLKSGVYKVDLGTNSYTNNLLEFSGISPQYKNRFADYDYIIGQVDPWDFGQSSVGGDIMGFQIKDHVEKAMGYKDIEGYVEPTSTVKVYINNDFEKELSTYGGYYCLKDVYYPKGEVEKVRIEEILGDGNTKTILTKEFDEKSRQQQIAKNDVVLGLSGTQNRFWANNGYLFQSNTRKFVTGGKYHTELSDRLSFENFFLSDKIVSMPQNSIWGKSVLNDRKYLNFTTMRNSNMLEGQTYMGAFNYRHQNPKMKSRLLFGVSDCLSHDQITRDGSGACFLYENSYKFNDDTFLKSSLFHYSPQFYSAGSSSGSGAFLSDKEGVSFVGSTRIKNTVISGGYSKYNSNMANYYQGGLIDIDEYNFIAKSTFKIFPTITLKANSKCGENTLAQIQSNSFELSCSKKIKSLSFDAGIRQHNYSNLYNSGDFSSYKSEYSNIYTSLNAPIGKKYGSATLEHEKTQTKSDALHDSYSTIRLGYSTPAFKTCNLNLMTGYRYMGVNRGFDFGLGVLKRLKSGSAVSLNYRFNRSPGYMVDNMFLPSTMRHSITLDFSELYGLTNGKLQVLGANNTNKGFVEAIAFLDTNQNGIQDNGEVNIENVTIKIKDDAEVLTTNKKGHTRLKPATAGIYQIQVHEDELPTLVSVHSKTNPNRIIKVVENEKTQVAFGLISSVGNVNGSITVKDEFEQQLKVDEFVISLFNETGNEVCYTNPNKDGTFSMSGLSPGKYKIGLDKQFLEAFHIFPDEKTENLTVEIPPEYKEYVNIDNVNLIYIYKI